jgi:4'-phosphopantetheinyl transferase
MSPLLDRESNHTWAAYAAYPDDLSDLHSRVHVWRARIDHLPDGLTSLLSDEEKARADRFRRQEDHDRFVASRAILRRILADCLNGSDESKDRILRFGYGPTGKPFLLDDPQLRFNVSHSDGLAVIAATRTGDVGIDIERQRLMKDMDGIVRLVFNEAERAAMLGCPPPARPMVFYRIWTRKEALIKAMGIGLSALNDPDAASLMQAGSRWFLTSLPHLDGYLAAIARPRSAHGIKLWSWPNAANMRSSERRKAPRPLQPQSSAFYKHEVRA